MSLDNKYKEDITRYLNREMPDRERDRFEKELDSNNELFEEMMKLMVTVNEKAHLKEIYKKVVRQPEQAKTRKLSWVHMAVAAIIILAISIGSILLLNQNNKPSSLLTAENLEYSSPYSFRNGMENDSLVKLTAHQYYSKGQFEQAAEIFRKIVEENKTDEESQFYYSLSLLRTKDKKNISLSIPGFESLLLSNRFGQQAHWFLALALFESGQPEKAKPYFKKIIKEGWNFEYKANSILDDNY